MGRGISLRRYEESKVFIPNRGDSFRVVIEAYDNELMPAEIFGHQRTLLNPWTGLEGEDFCFVCAPDDLVVYPVGNPSPTQQPAFYRKARIDVVVASRDIALEMWEAVKKRVCELVAALNRKDQLVQAETTRCGDDVVIEESQSVSASVSVSV